MPPVRQASLLAAAGDVGLAALVLAVALWVQGGVFDGPAVVAALISAAAAGLARTSGLVALALIWLAAAAGVIASGPLVGLALAVVITGFRCGRHGGPVTIWCAGLSVPVGAAAAVLLARAHPDVGDETVAVNRLVQSTGFGSAGAAAVLVAVFGAPVAVGLLVRTNARYQVSRAAREAAEARAADEHEIAQESAKQTQLARDVHDVIGHSLAVIIAQADAARLAVTDDAARTQLEQIAAVGRSSLAEVRDVLTRTDDRPQPHRSVPELDELIAGIRTAGHAVNDVSTGEPRPLAPETATAAYRVLQELLTNALKHGAGGTIDVTREWAADGLRLRVSNPVAGTAAEPVDGMGLTGIRSRVGGVGGTVRIALAGAGTDHAAVTATAYLPLA